MSGFIAFMSKWVFFSAFWGFITNPDDNKLFSFPMFGYWMVIGSVLYGIGALLELL